MSEKLHHSVMKFDRSNKFDFCYYGQVNSLRLTASVALKWASKHLWGNILLAKVPWIEFIVRFGIFVIVIYCYIAGFHLLL